MVGMVMVVATACWLHLELEGEMEGLVRLRLRIRGGQSLPGKRVEGDRRAICETYVT